MTNEELQAYNSMLKRWGGFIQRKFSSSAARFMHGKTGSVTRGLQKNHSRTELKLDKSITNRADMHFGMVDYIGFNFERHGVFVHKGVGRGYVMEGGMVIRARKPSKQQQQYAKDQNRAIGNTRLEGGMNRSPEEWFNPILDAALPGLADKVAEMNADAVVNATKMHIR